jgi:hypothetical protein
MNCTSRYLLNWGIDNTPKIITCINTEPHVRHRCDGYSWPDEDSYIEGVKTHVKDKQVGGDHYKGGTMQPWDVIDAFGLDFYEGNAIRYLLRWRKKNGVEDLQKAMHYIEVLIDKERYREGIRGG